jgi:hypothetical protein
MAPDAKFADGAAVRIHSLIRKIKRILAGGPINALNPMHYGAVVEAGKEIITMMAVLPVDKALSISIDEVMKLIPALNP